jgi:hypothetical protein
MTIYKVGGAPFAIFAIGPFAMFAIGRVGRRRLSTPRCEPAEKEPL